MIINSCDKELIQAIESYRDKRKRYLPYCATLMSAVCSRLPIAKRMLELLSKDFGEQEVQFRLINSDLVDVVDKWKESVVLYTVYAAMGLGEADSEVTRMLLQSLSLVDRSIVSESRYYRDIIDCIKIDDKSGLEIIKDEAGVFYKTASSYPLNAEVLIPKIGVSTSSINVLKFNYDNHLIKRSYYVTPNEIADTREAIKAAHGGCLCVNLGLGYYAYEAACKDEVTDVTVIEEDLHTVYTFEQYIIPLMDKKIADKIIIIKCKPEEFLSKDRFWVYNSIFVTPIRNGLWINDFFKYRKLIGKYGLKEQSIHYYHEEDIMMAIAAFIIHNVDMCYDSKTFETPAVEKPNKKYMEKVRAIKDDVKRLELTVNYVIGNLEIPNLGALSKLIYGESTINAIQDSWD